MYTLATALSSDFLVAFSPIAAVFGYFASLGKVAEGLGKLLGVFK